MFDLGDTALLAFTVTTPAQKKINATVVLTLTLPDGTLATPSVTNESVGEYTATYVPVQQGRHRIRWTATGAATKAKTDVLNVRATTSAAILSLDEARAHLNFSPADEAVDDEELREFIEAASHAVERHLGKVVARRSFTEQCSVRGWGSTSLALTHSPVISVTSVKSIDAATTWTVTDLDLNTEAGLLTVREGNLLAGPIEVVLVAGMATIPEHYMKATGIIVGHLWETQRLVTLGRQPSRLWGLATSSDEGIITPGGSGFAIPHRAVELLGARRPLVA